MKRIGYIVLLALLGSAPALAETGAIVLPAQLDVGAAAPDAAVPAQIWIVNPTAAAVAVTAIKPGCGCMTVTDRPERIEPGQAAAVHFTIKAPKEVGGVKHKPLRLVLGNQPQQQVTVTVRASACAEADRRPGGPRPVVCVPSALDLGHAAPGSTRSGSTWLINTTSSPVDLGTAKSDCGCITFADAAPRTLLPHGAVRLDLTMSAPKTLGRKKCRSVRLACDDGPDITVPITLTTVDPLEARVREYLAARDRGDQTHAATLLAPDCRLWVGERAGPGQPVAADGKGPWTDWDRTMNATTEIESFEVSANAVAVTLTEINDFYRLLDWPPSRLRVTYFFDASQRIAGRLVESIDAGDRPDTFERFIAWASANAPDELASVYANDRIVPSGENAGRWRAMLQDWRSERID